MKEGKAHKNYEQSPLLFMCLATWSFELPHVVDSVLSIQQLSLLWSYNIKWKNHFYEMKGV